MHHSSHSFAPTLILHANGATRMLAKHIPVASVRFASARKRYERTSAIRYLHLSHVSLTTDHAELGSMIHAMWIVELCSCVKPSTTHSHSNIMAWQRQRCLIATCVMRMHVTTRSTRARQMKSNKPPSSHGNTTLAHRNGQHLKHK